MPAIVIGLLAFAGILALLWLFSRANAQTIAQVMKTLLIVAGIGAVALLLWVGRYALAGIVPVLMLLALRMLPSWLGRLKARQAGRSYGQQSGVTTAFLAMRLDHLSGQATGEVLAGSFAGRSLDSLSLGEAITLRHEVAGDAQSLSLLDAWLDKRFPDWRQATPPGASSGGKMQRDEALAILELKEGASREEVESAYRRLMQKLHPDHGGSTWMAAKLNEARDLLLSETR